MPSCVSTLRSGPDKKLGAADPTIDVNRSNTRPPIHQRRSSIITTSHNSHNYYNKQFIPWITTHAVETIAIATVARNRALAPAPTPQTEAADVNITDIPTDTNAVTDTITTAIITIAVTTVVVTMTKTVVNEIQLQLQRPSPFHSRAPSSRGAIYQSTSRCSPCTWISRRGSG